MKRALWLLFAFVLAFSTRSARADDVGDSIHVTMSSITPNQYYFRGLLQNRKGVIGQASSEVQVALYDSDEFKFVTEVGAWASVHPGNKQKGADVPNVPAAWYEARVFGGVGIVLGGLDLMGRFVVYTSPNGSFQDIYELKLDGRFRDDTIWAGDDEDAIFRGIFPEVTLAAEVIGARDGAKSGNYAQLGLAPRARILYSSFLVVDAALPVSLGMSLGDYYETPTGPAGKSEDHFLGFASVGALLDIDARFVPERLGLWHVRPSLDLLFPTAQSGVPSSVTSAAAAYPKVDTLVVLAMLQTVLTF